jgi:hypothetical protein
MEHIKIVQSAILKVIEIKSLLSSLKEFLKKPNTKLNSTIYTFKKSTLKAI